MASTCHVHFYRSPCTHMEAGPSVYGSSYCYRSCCRAFGPRQPSLNPHTQGPPPVLCAAAAVCNERVSWKPPDLPMADDASVTRSSRAHFMSAEGRSLGSCARDWREKRIRIESAKTTNGRQDRQATPVSASLVHDGRRRGHHNAFLPVRVTRALPSRPARHHDNTYTHRKQLQLPRVLPWWSDRGRKRKACTQT